MNIKKLNKSLLKKICLLALMIYITNFFITYTYADENKLTSTDSNSQEQTQQIEVPEKLELLSKADILLDAKTGNILYENKADEQLYPASTTKLMTAILTMENCQLTDEITVKAEWLKGIPRSYTIADLRAGETFTVDQLMHVLLIPSANDAANVLACHMSGSIDEFANKMNEKAKEIGCTNTHFVNPSGVHDDNHYSTAHDMALIGLYACKFDTITEYAKILNYDLPNRPDGKERKFSATNTLLNPKHKYYYEYATGLKTGYTEKAKSCIVATAKKDDIELLCVVLGGDKTEDRKSERELDCKTLFDYGFNYFEYKNICNLGESIDISNTEEIPEYLKNQNLIYSDSLNLLVQKNKELKPTIHFDSEKQLPIYKNSVVGNITYQNNGKDYTVYILTSEDILPAYSGYASIALYALAVVLVVIIAVVVIKRKKKKPARYFKHSFYL